MININDAADNLALQKVLLANGQDESRLSERRGPKTSSVQVALTLRYSAARWRVFRHLLQMADLEQSLVPHQLCLHRDQLLQPRQLPLTAAFASLL